MTIPYKRILLNALLFGCLMTAVYVVKAHYGSHEYLGGILLYEFLLWCLVGSGVAYSGWRADTYLDRKNADWRKRKDG